jgi:two-component system response regulator RegX3
VSSLVLLAESVPSVRDALDRALQRECFQVEPVTDGVVALSAALQGTHDVVLLDLDLRGLSGLDVLRRLRVVNTVPVVVLSARESDVDHVLALELGADAYLREPCEPAAIVGQVRALLRRCEYERAVDGGPVRTVGGIRLDLGQREVVVDGRPVHLTAAELKLLALLTEVPGRTVTRREILHRLWGSGHVGYEHLCDVHISNLRHKVERDPRSPQRIVTLRGMGYKLVAA